MRVRQRLRLGVRLSSAALAAPSLCFRRSKHESKLRGILSLNACLDIQQHYQSLLYHFGTRPGCGPKTASLFRWKAMLNLLHEDE